MAGERDFADQVRRSMCVQCRTALGDGEPCDADATHDVVSLFDLVQREALVEAAWGPASVRLGAHQGRLRARRAGGIAGILAGLGGIYLTWLIAPEWGPLYLIGAFAAAALVSAATARAVFKPVVGFPAGAAPAQLTQGKQIGRCGEISGANALISPATGTDCVGYALELRLAGDWGDEVMYRDAACGSFEVHLDDGGIAHVPAGRFRLLGSMRQEIDVDNLELEDYMGELDPHRSSLHLFDPLRYNIVCEQLLLPGDKIELVSTFEPRVTVGAGATLYRDSAPSALAPIGVPVLRLLTPVL